MSSAKSHPVSPLAPKSYPDLAPIAGVRFATAEAGIKYKNRTDVLLMVFAPNTRVAGVFTRSKCASAPVEWCKAQLGAGVARALVVNSGNANAFTGKTGAEATAKTARLAAEAVGCAPQEVFLSSTGVIGEPLDASRFEGVLAACAARLADAPFLDAARAIMTTDTYPKLATRQIELEGQTVTISGMAKGAGMIAPDMATMLAYIFTDMAVAPALLQSLLVQGVGPSFNSITVDSDTSTSDTVLAFATGAAAARGVGALETEQDERTPVFAQALNAVLKDLALMVVRDGEGAQKQITVEVEGAVSEQSARRIARSIADSPLVKTAVAGEDANWGRVVMAVGKAGEPAERDLLTIRFGDLVVAEQGARSPGYSEAAASAYMKNDEIVIGVDLGLGSGKATIYSCDLTHGYIDINGNYRS